MRTWEACFSTRFLILSLNPCADAIVGTTAQELVREGRIPQAFRTNGSSALLPVILVSPARMSPNDPMYPHMLGRGPLQMSSLGQMLPRLETACACFLVSQRRVCLWEVSGCKGIRRAPLKDYAGLSVH